MNPLTDEQMYLALCKAAAMVKEEAQNKCPHFHNYVPTSKGDEHCVCDCYGGEEGQYGTCGWPHECPMMGKEEK